MLQEVVALSTSSTENENHESLLTPDVSQAIRDGTITGYECNACNTKGLNIQVYCPNCHSSKINKIVIDGVGKIISYTIQTIAPDPFINEVPYAWAVIELDCGVTTTGWIPFISNPHDLAIGEIVKLTKSYKSGMVFEKVQEKL